MVNIQSCASPTPYGPIYVRDGLLGFINPRFAAEEDKDRYKEQLEQGQVTMIVPFPFLGHDILEMLPEVGGAAPHHRVVSKRSVDWLDLAWLGLALPASSQVSPWVSQLLSSLDISTLHSVSVAQMTPENKQTLTRAMMLRGGKKGSKVATVTTTTAAAGDGDASANDETNPIVLRDSGENCPLSLGRADRLVDGGMDRLTD